MAKYKLDEEQRDVVHAALQQAEANIKSLRKKNEEEKLHGAVRDCDARLEMLRGTGDGKPGLLQIFSNQTEAFGKPDAVESDPRQQSIDDALKGDGKKDEGAKPPKRSRRKRAVDPAAGKEGEVIEASPAGIPASEVPDDQRTATTADGSDIAGGTDVDGGKGIDRVRRKLGGSRRRAPAAGNLADTVQSVTEAAGVPVQ